MSQSKGYLVSLPWSLDYPGGVNEVVKHLSAEFEKDGIPVLIHQNSYRDQKQSPPDGLLIKPLPAYPTSLKSRLIYQFLKKPVALYQWTQLIRNNQIRYIHIHYPVLSSHFFQMIKDRTKIKIICSLHGTDLSVLSTETEHHKKWSDFFEDCDLITTCSAHLKSEFLKLFPNEGTKTLVLHNGIDLESMQQELKAEPSITLPINPFIVNVATYEHKKGQDILLKGFANYCTETNNTELELVFAGRKGAFLQELQSLARKLGVSERVTFLTNLTHQDAVQLINHALCFALPSRIEPFGIVLLEAGYCETPVIAHAVGGVTEFLQDQENSTLILTNTPEEWAQKLNKLMQDDNQSLRQSKQLKQTVEQNFGWGQVYRKLTDAIAERLPQRHDI